MTSKARQGRTAADRLPEAPWTRVWALGVGCALLVLLLWEAHWRTRGWVPTASDPAAWVMARERVESGTTALLGSSRMQADLDPAAWAEAMGQPAPVMLALFGSTPVPALEDLAEDPQFRGRAVVDFFPGAMLDPEESEASIRAVIDAYRMTTRSPGRWVETRLSYATNPELVFRRPVLSARSLLEMAWDRAWPNAVFEWPSRGMRRDRFYPMEFPERDEEARAPRNLDQLERRAWTEETAAMFARVERAVDVIQGRGGEVVFVHFPHCGNRRIREDLVYPRPLFWDRFAAQTAGRAVHFADYPSLAAFECPDGSHLDRDDTAAFTRALAEIVTAAEVDR